nr:hypothetical protein [uncultured Mediterranean phage uvMED]BAR29922.1 hypothetical protein [uncultured Mediterranean phage uvMED]
MISIFCHLLAPRIKKEQRIGPVSKVRKEQLIAQLDALDVGESIPFSTYYDEFIIRTYMDDAHENTHKRFNYHICDTFTVKRDR